MSSHQFPSNVMDSLNHPPILNSKRNIISGPNQGDYWYHSSGLETPEYREEGPFPIQGNIGSLLKQEVSNYAFCSNNNSVGGGPNCTGVFNQDVYTTQDTCGENCTLKAPESFGIQSFGMTKDKMTNIHGLHAYQNVRAAVEGRGPSSDYGCYEFVPNLKSTDGNSCELNYSTFENNTTADFTRLPQSRSFTKYNYTQ